MAKGTRGDGNGRKGNGGEEQEEKGGLIARIGSVFTRSEEGEEGDESKGMKATDMLREDHEKVRALFKQYEAAGENAFKEKKEIVGQISRELDVHAKIEEEIFYQAFRNAPEEKGKKVVRESFEEHKIVKTLLGELAGMKPQDEQYDAKVTVLQEGVEHHADEEERELFPDAEELLGDEGLERLGAEMEDRKEELLREFERGSSSRSRTGATTAARIGGSRSKSSTGVSGSLESPSDRGKQGGRSRPRA